MLSSFIFITPTLISSSKEIKMQAAATTFAASSLSLLPPTKSLPLSRKFTPAVLQPSRRSSAIKASATVTYDASVVDYSSMSSVFPAEACETIGGEACNVDMYPEVRLKPEARRAKNSSEMVDREYLEYDSPKTVFLDEACDDLGGEFCQANYQTS